jgi:hypothetical protein
VYWRRNGLQLVGKGDSDGGLGDLDFGHDVLYGSYTHLDHLQLEHFSVDSITGKLQLMPSTVTLHSVRASLLHGKLASSGTINYQDERASPCDMDFKLRVHDLQIAGLLPPPTGGEEPLVEGLFSLSTALRAEGRNPLDLALGTFGDIDLSGRNGVYRGLAGRGGKASKASKVAGNLTFSRQLKAIGRMLDEMEELRFSQMKLSLLRESKTRLKVDQFSVASPLMRIEGQGSLTAIPGKKLDQGPLDASINLATRGDMSILFDGMGLLKKGSGSAGYRAMTTPIDIGGTLAEPDTSALWELLDEAADNAGGSFGLGLKTVNRKLKKSQSAASR